jgi:hypothetical protein
VNRVTAVLRRHWQEVEGFTVPNPAVYPWMWLWDSCFHAIIWSALGDGRAATELQTVFSIQSPSGFVPHIGYQSDPGRFAAFWGQPATSTLTQPPMYGHAVRALADAGTEVDELIGPATRGLRFLLDRRRAPCGLIRVFHPWETGTDDSPRWEAWQGQPFERDAWYAMKGELIKSLALESGQTVANPRFDVCSAGFNALVAWNARELAELTGDHRLASDATELAQILDRFWHPDHRTWADVSPDGTITSACRTIDGLLGVLVTERSDRVRVVSAELDDPTGFGLAHGPAGVHPSEGSFDPRSYWRGVAWPIFDYLFWVAAVRRDDRSAADRWASRLITGALTSQLSEYRDPTTGRGGGASPHSWAGLSVVPLLRTPWGSTA